MLKFTLQYVDLNKRRAVGYLRKEPPGMVQKKTCHEVPTRNTVYRSNSHEFNKLIGCRAKISSPITGCHNSQRLRWCMTK